ncbi:MAG: hypothetical protein ACYDAC_06325, partial [Candidatus Dormibacteria bacterium]
MCDGVDRSTAASDSPALIGALRAAAARFVSRRRERRDLEAVVDELVALRHVIDLLELEFARATVPLSEDGV